MSHTRFQSIDFITMKINLLEDIVQRRRTLNEVAGIFHISRQSVSKWLSRYRQKWEKGVVPLKPWPKSGAAWNRTSEDTESIVCVLAKQFPGEWPIFLALKLQELHGIDLNQSTVFRILRRHKTRYVRKWDWRERRQTLYVCASPGQEVQMDTCFPFWRSRPEVQYDMLDDCSRFVNSQMHMELSVRSSMEFVYKSIRILPFRITAIRTDCWVEFWPGFTKFLQSLGIKHIKNPPYTPEHNGKVERYHRTLWKSLWDFENTIDIHEYRLRLKLFVDHYNYRKPHSWLGMFGMTPAQKIWHTITKSLLQRVLCTSWDICYSSRDVNLMLQFNTFFFPVNV